MIHLYIVALDKKHVPRGDYDIILQIIRKKIYIAEITAVAASSVLLLNYRIFLSPVQNGFQKWEEIEIAK